MVEGAGPEGKSVGLLSPDARTVGQRCASNDTLRRSSRRWAQSATDGIARAAVTAGRSAGQAGRRLIPGLACSTDFLLTITALDVTFKCTKEKRKCKGKSIGGRRRSKQDVGSRYLNQSVSAGSNLEPWISSRSHTPLLQRFDLTLPTPTCFCTSFSEFARSPGSASRPTVQRTSLPPLRTLVFLLTTTLRLCRAQSEFSHLA